MNTPIVFNQPVKPIKHRLYEIDSKHEIAYCTACGWTEVHRSENSTKQNPKFYCTKRFQEIKEAETENRRLRAAGKAWHILSEVDPEHMTANCSICGPTKIQKRTYKQSPRYACATNNRRLVRKYRRTHYTLRSSKPLAHVLSKINEETKTGVCSKCGPVEIYMWQGEKKIGRRCSNATVKRIPGAEKVRREINTNTINRYKAEYGCKRCGYNENLLNLDLYKGVPERKALEIEKLLGMTSKELIDELENCEIFCVNCRGFVNYELFLENLKAIIDY
jgi:hypothetical protein